MVNCQGVVDGSVLLNSVRRKWLFVCGLCFVFIVLCRQTLNGHPIYLASSNDNAQPRGDETSIVHEGMQVTGGNYDQSLAECGEVCQYVGAPVKTNVNAPYQQLHKSIDCPNILRRMAYTNHSITYPPPKEPPPDRYEEFTQFGKSPIRHPLYFVEFFPEMKYINRTYEYQELAKLISQAKDGVNVNAYNDSGCMLHTIQKYHDTFVGRSGLVIGTQYPWLEAMLLAHDAKHLTTLEYGHLDLQHPSLKVHNPYEFAKMYLHGEVEPFQFAATFSSLEHSGLGRYGDPLNPYGDLEAMAQIWCMLQPGGTLIVAVPGMLQGNDSYIQWNAHRVYGTERLSQFTANWNFQHMVKCDDLHIILVLKKP